MARIENTVFISYRRIDVYTALAVYENLKNQGYDIFFDYRSISSGDFEQIISSNIRARAHFLLILTPTALERCNEPGDWLRREIELAIDEQRNIVPLFFKGFRFGVPPVSEKLTGKLENLSRYNGLNVHEDYFDEAMHRLRTQYLNIPLDTVLHPLSADAQKMVREEQVAADRALERIEDIKELVKQTEEKPIALAEPDPLPALKAAVPVAIPHFKIRLIGGLIGSVLLLALVVWGASSLLNNQLTTVPTSLSTETNSLLATHSPQPTKTNTSSLTETFPPTPPLGIGSTLISSKDNMVLLFVPAGEFIMGSDAGAADERPAHTVYLDSFWIDRNEVTNAMYARCVNANLCNQPAGTNSYSQDEYFGTPEYDNYPVVYVTWNDAADYCTWANRRLPTEAEWEKAARGENAFVYPWGNDFDGTKANFCDQNCSFDWADKSFDDHFADTAPVGSYPNGISPYGALDMAGNVWEWVADWYGDTYYVSSPSSNPLGPDSGQDGVVRGGAWNADSNYVRSALRFRLDPASTLDDVGFRCAVSQTAAEIPSLTQAPTLPRVTLNIGSTMTSDRDGMTLLYVPAGDFTMGSDTGDGDEKPVHTVYLDAFWIDQTEVTNKMYSLCVVAGVCKEPTDKSSNTQSSYYGNSKFDNYPVIYVDWNMARTYCEWVDRRLPSEAEWEKAARGENGLIYPWGNNGPNNHLLNHNNHVGDTTEVGKYPNGVSPYGALDMAGNVWEWVADWYDASYYATLGENVSNPQGPTSGQYRMLRGGAWNNLDTFVRSADRIREAPTLVYKDVGFRCAMSVSP